MFLDELSPFVREMAGHPVAFLGGFVSGVLRLNLSEDPVKGWLEKQTGTTVNAPASGSSTNNQNGNGPQTISIE